jgi:hypothetical protein
VPGLEELQKQLASLRKEAAALLREGATPSQILRLRRECVRLWAAIEASREARSNGA